MQEQKTDRLSELNKKRKRELVTFLSGIPQGKIFGPLMIGLVGRKRTKGNSKPFSRVETTDKLTKTQTRFRDELGLVKFSGQEFETLIRFGVA